VTVAFAVGTVALSNWYMQIAGNRRSVTICDVGEQGKIARRNRFEALFRGSPGTQTTDVARGQFTAMNHQRFSRGTWLTYQQAVSSGREAQFELVEIPVYTGRVPARYTISQYLPQWTPQLNRLFTFAPAEESVEFDWGALATRTADDALSADGRRAIAQAVQRAFGSGASVQAARGENLLYLGGPAGILQQDSPLYEGNTPAAQQYRAQQQMLLAQQRGRGIRETTFLQDICTPFAQGGLYSVVSQVSPTGGKEFEDLALLDPSDPRQWLLIVIVEQGDDLVVYRKLYTGES
jgi:hypothetical protein